MDNLIKIAQDAMWTKKEVPSFKSGDTITVSYRIVEGNKERIQSFRGVVIQIKGRGITKMFTIRKVSNGVGVERIFPLYSPHIDSIEVNKVGVVRRSRIYYLRDLTGKKARIKEKRYVGTGKKEEYRPTDGTAAGLVYKSRRFVSGRPHSAGQEPAVHSGKHPGTAHATGFLAAYRAAFLSSGAAARRQLAVFVGPQLTQPNRAANAGRAAARRQLAVFVWPQLTQPNRAANAGRAAARRQLAVFVEYISIFA